MIKVWFAFGVYNEKQNVEMVEMVEVKPVRNEDIDHVLDDWWVTPGLVERRMWKPG